MKHELCSQKVKSTAVHHVKHKLCFLKNEEHNHVPCANNYASKKSEAQNVLLCEAQLCFRFFIFLVSGFLVFNFFAFLFSRYALFRFWFLSFRFFLTKSSSNLINMKLIFEDLDARNTMVKMVRDLDRWFKR